MKRKFTKAEVEFQEEAKGNEQCQGCRHFEVYAPERCEIVEGEVDGDDWCIMWSNKQREPYAGISGKETKS